MSRLVHPPQPSHTHATHAPLDTFPPPPQQQQQPLYAHLPLGPPTPPPTTDSTTRTNDTLNLSVLQRHLPTTHSIDLIVPYAVIYHFHAQKSSWEKCGIEGTLFVVRTETPLSMSTHQPHATPPQGNSREGYAVVVLNRRGLENFVMELKTSEGVQLTEEYVIIREDAGEEGGKIWGVWVFEEEEGSTGGMRAECGSVILERARRIERRDAVVDGVGEGKQPVCEQQEQTYVPPPSLMALLNTRRMETCRDAAPAGNHQNLGQGQVDLLHLFKQAG